MKVNAAMCTYFSIKDLPYCDCCMTLDIPFPSFTRLLVDCLEGSSSTTTGFKIDLDECHFEC